MEDNILDDLRTRCQGISRLTGERCRRYVAPGHRVCRTHGGANPQTLAAARRRLAELRDNALDRLDAALEAGIPCPTCGRTDSDKDPVVIKAAQIVLDRSGLGPSSQVEVLPQGATEQQYLSLEELAQQNNKLLERVRELKASEVDDDGKVH